MLKRLYFIFLLYTLFVSKTLIGKEITKQNLLWFAYFNTIEFKPKWSTTFDVQERIFTDKLKQHQLVFRGQLNFKLPKQWFVSAGFTYFLQSPHDPYSTSTLMIPELRPHIQFSNRNDVTEKLFLQHQYRVGKRFFRNTADNELISGFSTNFRFRYQISFNYVVFSINNKPVTLRLNNEIHVNAGKTIVNNVFDQNRIYIGMNFKISAKYFASISSKVLRNSLSTSSTAQISSFLKQGITISDNEALLQAI